MEARLAEAGTPVGSDAATLDVMEATWQAGKSEAGKSEAGNSEAGQSR